MATEKLAIIGIYPPPYGGVGVSLKRLIPYLDKNNIDYVVYNTGYSKTNAPRIRDVGWSPVWTLKMILFSRHKVVQLSTSRWWVRLFGAIIHLFTGAEIIIYARGYSLPDSYHNSGFFKKNMVRMTLRSVYAVIATNPDLKEQITQIGYPGEKIITVPPFIPPPETPSVEELPVEIRKFSKDKSIILAANGGYIYINGKDVYGLKDLVALMKTLVDKYPGIGLIVYLRKGAEKDKEKYSNLLREIENSSIKNNILFYTSPGEFYPVFGICDLFLRPTTTDGDSNSIREALYFGVPVVASDAVPRPEGTITYRAGDVDDLKNQVIYVLENIGTMKQKIKNLNTYNAADQLISVYRKLSV